MTLDEAIKHAEEVAEINQAIAYNTDDGNWMDIAQCEKCAEEHRQLAEWLKELKKLREQTEPEKCGDCISREAAIQAVTHFDDPLKRLYELPPVEPERKPGKWEWNQRTGEYECSECGCNPIYERTTPDVSEIDKYRYCRWCGVKMEDTSISRRANRTDTDKPKTNNI